MVAPPNAPPDSSGPASPVGLLAAGAAMVAWASSGVLAKGIDMGGLAIVFYRMWLYSGAVWLFLRARGVRLGWRALRVSLWGGLALGVDLVFFFTAVKATTIANATVIGAIQPVLVVFLAWPLFGETVRRSHVALSLVAIGGVAVVMFASAGVPEWSWRGDLLSVGALFAWTGYFVASKLTRSRVSAQEYTASTTVIATVVVTPVAFVFESDMGLPTATNWFWIGLLALGPGLLGHLLMNWSLDKIPIWIGSTLTLAIPVTSTLLAWAFLGEQVVLWQFLGMGVVTTALGAIMVGSRRRRPPTTAAAGPEPVTAPVPPA